MARALDSNPRFGGMSGYVLNMSLFLGVVVAIAFYLSPLSPKPNMLLVESFNANRFLNGLILVVLALGIIYNLRLAGMIGPAIRWVREYADSVDASRTKLAKAPPLIRALEHMLLKADKDNVIITQASTRALLDSVGTRIDEGREVGRYIANLLVFLGLLGTFWGLLQTVNAVGDTINGLATTGGAEGAVAQLITNLQEPLSGMGTAFSSSLFGLGGSLIVGYLDIQSGQAQNRFYSDLEDWFSSAPQSVNTEQGGAIRAYDGTQQGDVLEALGNIELALKNMAHLQNDVHDKSTDAIRAEIRQLGHTLVEGPQRRSDHDPVTRGG